LPIGWWIAYSVIAVTVWAIWPKGRDLPNDVWIGVLSFEGLLAALLASVGSTAITQGIVPATITFWSALDPRIGEKLAEGTRQWREDPTQGTTNSAFKNAFIVAINTLFLATFTYGRGIAGRQVPGQPLPDHGKQEYDLDFHRITDSAGISIDTGTQPFQPRRNAHDGAARPRATAAHSPDGGGRALAGGPRPSLERRGGFDRHVHPARVDLHLVRDDATDLRVLPTRDASLPR
jgi:hypothetical protein